MADVENVIIIGSGPAGYTAALYTARANLEPLVIEGFLWGGLLQQTTDVENYPGYPEGDHGPGDDAGVARPGRALRHALHHRQRDQARARRPSGEPHTVWIGDEAHQARAVDPRDGRRAQEARRARRGGARPAAASPTARPATPRSSRSTTRSSSAAATRRWRRRSSSRSSRSKVTIVHRRDEFRASAIMLDRARAKDNIEFLTPVRGRGVRRRRERRARGRSRCATPRRARARRCSRPARFIAIGHEPQSELVAGIVETDENGYVVDRGQVDAHERARACSRPATSSTTPTARPSPPPAPAARPRSTPSGTCATTPRCRRRRRSPSTGDLAEEQWAPVARHVAVCVAALAVAGCGGGERGSARARGQGRRRSRSPARRSSRRRDDPAPVHVRRRGQLAAARLERCARRRARARARRRGPGRAGRHVHALDAVRDRRRRRPIARAGEFPAGAGAGRELAPARTPGPAVPAEGGRRTTTSSRSTRCARRPSSSRAPSPTPCAPRSRAARSAAGGLSGTTPRVALAHARIVIV